MTDAYLTREQRRSRRRDGAPARSIYRRQLTQVELAVGRERYPVTDHGRPATRGECGEGSRPCPFVSCKHHLYLDVTRAGSIKLNFPDREPDDLEETCVLDIADEQGAKLSVVADAMNMTREGVRLIEKAALAKLTALKDAGGMDHIKPDSPGRRRLPVIVEDNDE